MLTPEEISIVRNAPSRFADWLIGFVQQNARNTNKLEKEKLIIIETMKTWWFERNWKPFLGLMEVKTDFLKKDLALNMYLVDLLKTQEKEDTRSLARIYFEFAFDQYHDGSDSFYIQMGFDRMDETWKLFKEAKKLDPMNVEIRSRFIGLMHQAGGGYRKELLTEIQELLQIPLNDAITFGKGDPKHYYDRPMELLQKFVRTGKLLLDDDLIESLNEITPGLRESSKNAMINEKGTVYNDMLTFLISNDSSASLEILKSSLENNKSAQEYFLESTKLFNTGNIEGAILTLKKSIVLNPDFAEAHYLFGKISLKLLVFSKAIQEFMKAIQLQPEVAKYHYALGEAYLIQNNNQEALIEFENTLKLNPFFEEAQNRIKEIGQVS